jgi:NDP-sugar pyrophosphorylase family protein
MQALILAGGKGTRLQPYTTVLPKPLMPMLSQPILEIIVRQLKHAGVEEIILAVGHLSQLIQAFFQDGSRFGVPIRYSFEDNPLGTAGPISLVMDHLDEDFMVMNGDLLTTLNYRSLFEFHRNRGGGATIGLFRREVKIDFGVIEASAECELEKYLEKPTLKFAVSMGVNVFKKAAVRNFLKPGIYMDIPDLMNRLKKSGSGVYCYSEPCRWLDIGRIDDYQQALLEFEACPQEFLPDSAR